MKTSTQSERVVIEARDGLVRVLARPERRYSLILPSLPVILMQIGLPSFLIWFIFFTPKQPGSYTSPAAPYIVLGITIICFTIAGRVVWNLVWTFTGREEYDFTPTEIALTRSTSFGTKRIVFSMSEADRLRAQDTMNTTGNILGIGPSALSLRHKGKRRGFGKSLDGAEARRVLEAVRLHIPEVGAS